MDKKRKKMNLLLRLSLALLGAVLLLTGIALVVYRDRFNLDSIKRWYRYRSLSLGDNGQAESFRCSSSESDIFADLDGDLLVCGRNVIGLYSSGGTRYIDQAVNLAAPAVDVCGGTAVVYDAGGRDLFVFRQRELVFTLRSDGSILSARLNHSGQLTVVSRQSGYRAMVTVYYDDFNVLVSMGLSSTYVMDARLSDDGKTLAAVCVGLEDGEFSSSLALYDLDRLDADGVSQEAVPFASCPLGGNVVLGLGRSAGLIWALGDQGLTVADRQGAVLGGLDWPNRTLKSFSLSGDGFAAALLSRFRTDSQSTLSVVDSSGQLTGTLSFGEQVLCLDAAGRYIAVLTADRLELYTKDLQLYSTLEHTQGAQKVLLHADGSAFLISSGTARLYVPQPSSIL